MGVCCSAGTDKERNDEHETDHQDAGEDASESVLSHARRRYLLRGVLDQMQVSELLLPCVVVKIQSDAALSQAWELLLDKELSAAPVWSPSKLEYIGFLEIQDAVNYVVRLAEAEHRSRGQCLNSLASAALQDFVATPKHLNRPTNEVLAGSSVESLGSLRDTKVVGLSPALYRTLSPAEVAEASTPAALFTSLELTEAELQVVDENTDAEHSKYQQDASSAQNPLELLALSHAFTPVSVTDSLLLVAQILQREKHVPVFDEADELCGVLTQSRFCAFLQVEQHFWEWQLGHEVLAGTVQQFGFGRRDLLWVRVSDTTIFVFTKMRDKQIFTLPVVDSSGVLVAVVQSVDIVRFIKYASELSLHLPILEFLERARELDSSTQGETLCTIQLEEEFTMVWDRMSQARSRVCFIVDSSFKPVGVISLGDALRALTSANLLAESLPTSVDVANTPEVEQQAIQLCTVQLDRDPLGEGLQAQEDALVTKSHLKYIWSHLPHRVLHHDWRLLYSISEHGASLGTVYHRCSMAHQNEACVTVIQDDGGRIFGCFSSSPWRSEARFYGNGEAFVFTFQKNGFYEHVETYKWEMSKPRNLQHSDAEALVMGVGEKGFGLRIDKHLSAGISSYCDIFDSPPLASKERFKILKLEVWGLGWRALRPLKR